MVKNHLLNFNQFINFIEVFQKINKLIKQEQYPNKVYCFIKDKKHQYNSNVSLFYKS